MPASATSARRQSVPVQRISSPILSSPISGQIMTRRMSMLFEPTTDNAKAQKIAGNRRHSMQIGFQRNSFTLPKKTKAFGSSGNANQVNGKMIF